MLPTWDTLSDSAAWASQVASGSTARGPGWLGATQRKVRAAGRTGEALGLLASAAAAQRWLPMTWWSPALGSPMPVPASIGGQVSAALPTRAGSAVEYRVVFALRRAGRVLPASCLAQAAAGQVMLRRRGIPGLVVIGLRAGEPGTQWQAHAWLLGEAGALVGGSAADGFTATTMFQVPPGRVARRAARAGRAGPARATRAATGRADDPPPGTVTRLDS